MKKKKKLYIYTYLFNQSCLTNCEYSTLVLCFSKSEWIHFPASFFKVQTASLDWEVSVFKMLQLHIIFSYTHNSWLTHCCLVFLKIFKVIKHGISDQLKKQDKKVMHNIEHHEYFVRTDKTEFLFLRVFMQHTLKKTN